MKKILSLALIFMLMFAACGQGKEKYPPQKADFGNGDYFWNYFNDEGLRIKCESYRNNVLEEIHLYEYDADGNETKQTTTDANGNEIKRVETTYENGLRNYEVIYTNGVMAIESWFNETDNTELSKSYDENGQLESWYQSYHDEELGDFTVFYRGDDTMYLLQEYTHDEEGRFVTISTYLDENEEPEKVVQKTNIPNGYKEEILYERNRE